MIGLPDLMRLSLSPFFRRLRLAYLRHLEQHYLISASTEHDRARQHQANAAHYQKMAALSRSKQFD